MQEPYDETPTPPTLLPHNRGALRNRGLGVALRIPFPDHAVLGTKRLAAFEPVHVKSCKEGVPSSDLGMLLVSQEDH